MVVGIEQKGDPSVHPCVAAACLKSGLVSGVRTTSWCDPQVLSPDVGGQGAGHSGHGAGTTVRTCGSLKKDEFKDFTVY
ncbi:unnamed protein product [Ilex paraguariensis]|uniref:Uncharacterized protein n=1 Tax=Ilex paraguariensis TaxID=185542 RepID=A0ABC8R923_9AQUA